MDEWICASCGETYDSVEVELQDMSFCKCGGALVVNDDDLVDWDE